MLPKTGSATARVLGLLCLASAAFAQQENESDIRARWEYFYNQRAYPTGRIPANARLNALQQARPLKPQGPSVGPTWTLVGPKPTLAGTNYFVSGRVSALAVHPTNPSIVYLGAADGGVWKTTDAGVNWTPLTDTQASLAVGANALDPQNPKTVYVGTGEQNFSGDSLYGTGVLKSTDGGATWSLITGPFGGPITSSGYYGGSRIGALAVHPTNSNIVLAGAFGGFLSQSGVFRSTDGGATWSSTPVLANSPATSIVFDPTNGNNVYATLGYPGSGVPANGVYRSTDGGATWSPRNGTSPNILPATGNGRYALALAPSNPSIQFVAIENYADGTLLGLWKTTDAGLNWSQITIPNFCGTQCWYDMAVAISPANPNIVFVAGVGGATGVPYTQSVMRSTDGGATWQQVASSSDGNNLHVDQHALAFTSDGSKLYDGNDGGVWSSTNVMSAAPASVLWTNLNNTLAITQFYPGIALHPTDPNTILIGAQDNNTQLRNTASTTFQSVTCGDGAWAAIDQQNPLNMQTNCQNIQILRSTNGGTAWSSAQAGIANDVVQFIPPLVNDPSNGSRVYFGTYRVWLNTGISNSTPASWVDISGTLSTTSTTISSIAVAPSDSNTVWATLTSGKVYVTHSALSGAAAVGTWANVTNGLPVRTFTNIKVSPTNANTAYLTLSGFSVTGNTQGHVYFTTNGGTSWTNMSGNLPNTPANDIVVDPDIPNTFYVATDIGVFKTSDGGTTWAALGNGLPNVACVGMKLHQPSRKLRVATHGRGVWEVNVPVPGTPVQITVNTSPANLAFTVDGGASVTAPQVFNWNSGDTHTINCTSPQGPTGTLYTFANWTDGPTANPRVLTVPATNTTYTCNFSTQYYLNMTANPPAGGNVGPASGFYNAGSSQNISATANPGYTFTGWSCFGTGCYSGTSPSTSVTMNAALTQTANFTAGATFTPIRVNAGSTVNYTDPANQVWSADTGFGGGAVFTTSSPIAFTSTPYLYQTERFSTSGNLQYQFAVPAGTYNVRLKFAEIYFTAANQRKFDIAINGTTLTPGFDIVAAAGAANAPVDKVYSVASTGTITITLIPVVSLPKISAIEITQGSTPVSITPHVTTINPVSTQQFTANTTVNWSTNLGSINPSGLYTPPGSFTPGQVAIVTATSTADNTKIDTAKVNLLAGWTTLDVGAPAPGNFSYANGAYFVTGGGDFGGTADSFRYAYQTVTGDASITARVADTGCCVLPSKVGVIMRESSTAGAAHVYMSIYSNIVALLESRASTGAGTSIAFGGAGVSWVKLVRTGNTISGFVSADGNGWIPVGSPVTVTMASTYQIGFGVASSFGPAYTGTFDNLSISGPVSISIDQRLSTIAPAGAPLTFTSSVLGGAAGATWSVIPPLGSINPTTGVYTPPASVSNPSQQSVTINAVSTADITKTDQVVALLSSTLPQPVRVNSGGPATIDPNGIFWNADTGSITGNIFSSGAAIANTTTPFLYQTERFTANANLVYTYFVPNGSYNVKLKFAEIYFTTAGQRQTNIRLNGTIVQSNFDAFTAAGAANKAVDLTFPVTVTNGTIVISLEPVSGSAPKISAIEIM